MPRSRKPRSSGKASEPGRDRVRGGRREPRDEGRRGRRDRRAPRDEGPLELRNPHAAWAALQHRPEAALALQATGEGGPAWARVVQRVEELGLPIRRETERRDERPAAGGRATGLSLLVQPLPSRKMNELLQDTIAAGPAGLWLALEQIQDVRNLGAIFRTAAFFGVRGVLLTKDRSASLTAIACDTAAGGAETVPHATITNLARSLAVAREEYGLQIVGASEHATVPLAEVSRPPGGTLLVLGNEERGLRRLARETCDVVAAIPAVASGPGAVTSLNVSVAAGILMHALAPPAGGASSQPPNAP